MVSQKLQGLNPLAQCPLGRAPIERQLERHIDAVGHSSINAVCGIAIVVDIANAVSLLFGLLN